MINFWRIDHLPKYFKAKKYLKGYLLDDILYILTDFLWFIIIISLRFIIIMGYRYSFNGYKVDCQIAESVLADTDKGRKDNKLTVIFTL